MSTDTIQIRPAVVDVTDAAAPAIEAQAVALGLTQVQRLSDALYTMIDSDSKATGLLDHLVNAADGLCCDCRNDEERAQLAESCEPTSAVLWSQVEKIEVMIRAACYVAEREPHDSVPDLHTVVLPHAAVFAAALHSALQVAPDNMAPLHALAATPFAKVVMP